LLSSPLVSCWQVFFLSPMMIFLFRSVVLGNFQLLWSVFFLVHGRQATFFCHLMGSVEVSGLFLLLLSWHQPIAAVAKETEFQLEGFILVMLSTVMAGFRWTVTQLLLQVYYDSCMTLKMMTLFIQEMKTLLQKSGKYVFSATIRFCYLF
jgi:hypothetical protein